LNKDPEILASIKSGKNSQVLSYLYETTLRKVRHYILTHGGNMDQASDIFQDSVIILFNQVRKGKFDEKHAIDAFVYTVAKNLWLNKLRDEKRISNYEDMTVFEVAESGKDSLSDLITKERSAAVSKLFGQLNEKCRELLHYYNHEGLSMKEISEKLGYNNEQVAKASHYRCKQSLINLIKGNKLLENLLRN